MNARIGKTGNDTRELPIAKPSEPLPAIFSTYGRTGFSTTRKVRGNDQQDEFGTRPIPGGSEASGRMGPPFISRRPFDRHV